MNWQLALAIPVTFTGFLLLLESIEDMLNHFEGGAQLARSQRWTLPTATLSLPARQQQQRHSDIRTCTEWRLPWASFEVDYIEQLAHIDSSPRLVDRSHVAQLPFQNEATPWSGACEFAPRGGIDTNSHEDAFSHLQGIKVKDMEECY